MEFDFSKFLPVSNTTNISSISNTKRKFPFKLIAFIIIVAIVWASWQFILNVVAWITIAGTSALAIKKVGSSIVGLGK